MQLEGLVVHIAGSANADVEWQWLDYSHKLLSTLVSILFNKGCRFLVGVGKEPKSSDSLLALPLIFDWVVLEAIWHEFQSRNHSDKSTNPLVHTVGTSKTASQIPSDRKSLWEALLSNGLVDIEYVDPDLVSGAVRRSRMARQGDILIVLGGGEGVEHLAQQYITQGKPILPLDLPLGASCSDGRGGASFVSRQLMSHPSDFLRVTDESQLGSLLTQICTKQAHTSRNDVINAIVKLLESLAPPTAFFVRLLNSEAVDFAAVDIFFREIVTPVAQEAGYEPYQMGIVNTETAWMHDQIFTALENSSVVIADFTGHRPNCFLELGYALGARKRTLVVAKIGTQIPFDISPIEIHLWDQHEENHLARVDAFRKYWKRNINRPILVEPKRLF